MTAFLITSPKVVAYRRFPPLKRGIEGDFFKLPPFLEKLQATEVTYVMKRISLCSLYALW